MVTIRIGPPHAFDRIGTHRIGKSSHRMPFTASASTA
jgi:hypothetical protein